jgi:hypothetical protein
MYDEADQVAAPTVGAAGYEGMQQAIGAADAAPAGVFGSIPEGSEAAAAAPVQVVQAESMQEYIECLYNNMHSLRQGWSLKAREAGVRRARNAIRKDLRNQAAMAAAAGGVAGAQRDEGLLPLATAH